MSDKKTKKYKLFGKEITKEDVDVDKLLESEDFRSFYGVDMRTDNKPLNEATYYTCLKILSDKVSALPLKIHDEHEATKDHVLNTLLSLRPHPLLTASAMWKSIEFQVNHFGSSVILINRNKHGVIKSFLPLDMDNVEMIVDEDNIIVGSNESVFFLYRREGKDYKLFMKDVLYFVGMTSDGYTPMSVRNKLKTMISNASEASKYTNNYLKNGLHSHGIIKYVGDLSEENQTKLQERYARVAGGVEKAGKLLPLPLGYDYQSISTSLKDAQFDELQALSERQIANAFGVKMHQLNSLERSTHSNIEQQEKDFYVSTLQPKLTAYEQELSYKLLSDEELKNGYFVRFNVDAILRATIKERYEAHAEGIQGGFIKVNEARKKENLQPVPGGDRLMTNGNMIPVDMVGQQYSEKVTLKGGEEDE